MKLACVVLALLASQTLAVSVVRTELDSGRIERVSSEDANSAHDMLAEVEEMVKSHSQGDKPRIETIEELTKQLEKALLDTHKSAEDQVDLNLEAIKKCNDNKAAAISHITATTKEKVAEERQAHAECRMKEMDTHADMLKKCKHLKTWLKSLNSPEKEGSDDAARVAWVGKMDGYWCPKGEQAKEKSKTCKNAKKDYAAEKAKCDPLQSQFELGFCTWRVELTDACNAQQTCYDDALAAYKDHKAATTELIAQWKTEYVALKKIACYVNVWLADDNAETVDSMQLEKCQNLRPDETAMDIDFKDPVKKSVCSLAEVEKYPGTEEFKNAEYEKFLEAKEKIGDKTLYHFVNEPVKCEGDETTMKATTETTTPEPVTTQEPETTPEVTTPEPETTTEVTTTTAVIIPPNDVGNIGNGLACQDGAFGNGFILYSKENVYNRFKATPPYKGGAHHFVCVRYDDGWKYDTNSKWIDFTPSSTDILVARSFYSHDRVADLKGRSEIYRGINLGYADGDLKFKVDFWDGKANAGEFHVSGTTFTPQAKYKKPDGIQAGDLGSGLACQDSTGGSGFIMYSKQQVNTRFTEYKPHKEGAHHFICVRYDRGWKYDTNSKWIDFTSTDTDILMAAADFTADKVRDLKGKSGIYQGMKLGYDSGDLSFHANAWKKEGNKYEVGEFQVRGTKFFPQAEYMEEDLNFVGDIGNGLACQDSAHGDGFIMYSDEDVYSRFKSNPPYKGGAHHFVCVRYDNGWKYDTNSKWIDYTPTSTDILVARAYYTHDKVTDLKGRSEIYQGINLGYAGGDLKFKVDIWKGVANAGEFTVSGLTFTPQAKYTKPEGIQAGNLGSGIACQDGTGGSGFIMYSKQQVNTRFTKYKPHVAGAHHFICVRYSGGWKYDTNSKWIDFDAVDTDILMARADFSGDKVTDLKGKNGMYQNMKLGYESGDLVFKANRWAKEGNKYQVGEFQVSGTRFFPQAEYVNSNLLTVGDIGNGMACNDKAKGTGYIMFSRQDVFTRFKNAPPYKGGARHFVCVKYYDGGWTYDTNSKYVSFSPTGTDVLVAEADFSKDTVKDLKGSAGSYEGIAKGYASGDLSFTANYWSGKNNAGEFHVDGTGFSP